MKRTLIAAAAFAACLTVAVFGAAAGAKPPGPPPPPKDVVCPQDTNAFTGTARNLIVPAEGFCEVTDATITHDLIVQSEAGVETSQVTVGNDVNVQDDAEADLSQTTVGHDLNASGPAGNLHLELTTIDHDLVASKPVTVQTSRNGPGSPGGPVSVGHDFVVNGSPDGEDFVFDGICSLTVGHDLRFTNRSVTLGIAFGGQCAGQGKLPNTIGHDLVITGNTALVGFFGPSSIQIGSNHVGHDLVFNHNTAASGGTLEVSGNVVGHDARCDGNDPAVTAGSPNTAGHHNTCG
jgi:hypothetical protein